MKLRFYIQSRKHVVATHTLALLGCGILTTLLWKASNYTSSFRKEENRMTQSQIAYLQLQEAIRSNRANEEERARSNRAVETETARHNRASEVTAGAKAAADVGSFASGALTGYGVHSARTNASTKRGSTPDGTTRRTGTNVGSLVSAILSGLKLSVRSSDHIQQRIRNDPKFQAEAQKLSEIIDTIRNKNN